MQKISVSASSQTGMVRDHNEDAVLVSHQIVRDNDVKTSAFLTPSDRYVVAVCDGLGGQNAGEVASMDAAEQFAKRVDTLRSELPIEHVHKLMDEWVKDEHAYLVESGRDVESMAGMGTTLVAVLFYEGHICWLNCGDSRLYRFRNGILRQLSTDHSLIQFTHKKEDAHVIVNCLGGGGSQVYLDFTEITDEVLEGDVLLLCSDGLTDMLSDEEIEKVLQKTTEATVLTTEAVQHGGLDNVSACVITLEALS